MKYLIDTQALLWYAKGDARLGTTAKLIIESSNTRLLSIATVWEIGIKVSLGKLTLDALPLDAFIEKQLRINFYKILPIELNHIFQLTNLPHHHKDPFDRILIAQAISENIPIVSIDAAFDNYGVQRIW